MASEELLEGREVRLFSAHISCPLSAGEPAAKQAEVRTIVVEGKEYTAPVIECPPPIN